MTTAKVKNVKGKGIKTKQRRFTKKGDSWFDLNILCAYLVQSRGTATVEDVYGDVTERLGAKVHRGTCSDALEALRRAQVLVESADSGGARVLSMRRYNFSKNPEIAEVDKLIEELRTDPLGEVIVDRLTKKNNGRNKTEWPTHGVSYKVTARLTSPLLGGHIWAGNLGLQRAYFKLGRYLTLHTENGKVSVDKVGNPRLSDTFSDHTEVPRMFDRVEGALELAHAGCVKGALLNALNVASPQGDGRVIKTTDFKRFVTCSCVLMDADAVEVLEFPSNYNLLPVQRPESGPGDRGNSASPQRYESVPAGTEISFEMSCPSEHFVSIENMAQWLWLMLPRLPRGMSHARGNQGYGRMELVALDVLDFHDPGAGFNRVWENGEFLLQKKAETA